MRWLGTLLLCAGCSVGTHAAPPPPPSAAGAQTSAATAAHAQKPELRIVLITDLAGALEPCGCKVTTLGGIDRLVGALDQLRADATPGVPTVVLTAGALFDQTRATTSDPIAQTQAALRRKTLLAALEHIPVDAFLPVPPTPDVQPPRLLRVAGLHVAAFALVGASGSQDPEANVTALIAGAHAQVATLRAAGADLVVLVAALDAAGTRALAQGAAADVVVQVGAHALARPSATQVGDAIVLSSSAHGEGFSVLELWPANGAGMPPAARAAALRLLQPMPRPVSVRQLPVDFHTHRNTAVRALLQSLHANINAASAQWHVEPLPVSRGKAGYVGSRTCAACHTQAYFWWQTSRHGRAYATLVKSARELDPQCVSCHLTGYLQPGGSTISAMDELQAVGCESCHGPGSLHAGNPASRRSGVHRAAPAGSCLPCHDADHSDAFEYGSYRARLLASGHGVGSGKVTGPAAQQAHRAAEQR